jgi:hypothetical protein
MRPSVITLILLFFISLPGFSQIIHRIVVSDATTRTGIPYATVKIVNKVGGTYADDEGRFEVNTGANDSLMVTCVGYMSKIVIPRHDTIFLEPVSINLGEVKVNAAKLKEYSIGLKSSNRGVKYLFCGNLVFEMVLKVNIPESYLFYRIKGVKIDAHNIDAKSLARLHIYSPNKAGFPDIELLTEDIIINDHIKANNAIDLSKLNLIFNERVLFVGFEAILSDNAFNPRNGECFGFGLTYDENEPLTYTRILRDPKYQWILEDSQHGRLPTKSPAHPKEKSNPTNLMVSLIID